MKRLFIVLVLAFSVLAFSSGVAHAAPAKPATGCWQDNCDFQSPYVCTGVGYAFGSAVNVYDSYNHLQGTIQMFKTNASHGGCMDVYALFKQNSGESLRAATVTIERSDYLNGDLDAVSPNYDYFQLVGPNNYVSEAAGYEGMYEDCFRGLVTMTSNNGGYSYAQTASLCPA